MTKAVNELFQELSRPAVLQVLERLRDRTFRSVTVAKRRFERDRSPENEERYLLSAEEYYCVASVYGEFRIWLSSQTGEQDGSFNPGKPPN